jgi:hypothetical protein
MDAGQDHARSGKLAGLAPSREIFMSFVRHYVMTTVPEKAEAFGKTLVELRDVVSGSSSSNTGRAVIITPLLARNCRRHS